MSCLWVISELSVLGDSISFVPSAQTQAFAEEWQKHCHQRRLSHGFMSLINEQLPIDAHK